MKKIFFLLVLENLFHFSKTSKNYFYYEASFEGLELLFSTSKKLSKFKESSIRID